MEAIKIIVVENESKNLQLAVAHLRRGGNTVIGVGDITAFNAALQKHPNAKVVVAGFRPVAENGGLDVLTMAKKFLPDVRTYLLVSEGDMTDKVADSVSALGIDESFSYTGMENGFIKEGLTIPRDTTPRPPKLFSGKLPETTIKG